MSNRLNNPDEQFCDTTGTPYAGGFLYFYQSGTNTPLNTYSNSGLTIANLNPIVLDSAGRAGSVFLQNAAYKVVLTDVNGVQIWTMDPVWSSDYSTLAQVQPFSGNPNGQLAGTASTQGSMPGSSMVWDYVNKILYICTTTGTASTTVWTAVNASSPTPVTPSPAGYLTLTSGTPSITADVVAATAVYYTPYDGNVVPIYNGTAFTNQTFSELTLTLTTSQAANAIYDVFVFNNNGVLTLVTGPSWANVTAGSCTRGTGAGTTQISLFSGLWVNSVQISGRNGSSTYTIPANTATYLGSLYMDGVAGQITCHRSFGQNRKWGVWNAYNRLPIYLKAGDATTGTLPSSPGWTWTPTTSPNLYGTWRAANNIPVSFTANSYNVGSGTACNGLVIFQGLAEEIYDIYYTDMVTNTVGGANSLVGIGMNSISASIGRIGMVNAPQTVTGNSMVTARYLTSPLLGINTITALEQILGGSGTLWAWGSELYMTLSAEWRG